jgi:hypothetical protein
MYGQMPPRQHGPRLLPRVPRRLWLAAALLAFGLPSPAAAQITEPLDDAGARSPMELLLEHRDRLELTPDQVDRLAAIRTRLAAANDPLVNRMVELRQQWQRERLAAHQAGRRPNPERMERIRTAAAPLHTRIQQNNRTAMQAVNRLLAPSQRARLRAIVEERRGASPGGGGEEAGAGEDD